MEFILKFKNNIVNIMKNIFADDDSQQHQSH